jgi:adenylosuccinate lyase
MFRGRTHGQHASTIAVGVALFSAEDALAVRPQDVEIAIPIGATRGTVHNADSAAKPLAAICPKTDTPSQRQRA